MADQSYQVRVSHRPMCGIIEQDTLSLVNVTGLKLVIVRLRAVLNIRQIEPRHVISNNVAF